MIGFAVIVFRFVRGIIRYDWLFFAMIGFALTVFIRYDLYVMIGFAVFAYGSYYSL